MTMHYFVAFWKSVNIRDILKFCKVVQIPPPPLFLVFFCNIILENYLFVYEIFFKEKILSSTLIIKFQSELFEKSHLQETFHIPAGCIGRSNKVC